VPAEDTATVTAAQLRETVQRLIDAGQWHSGDRTSGSSRTTATTDPGWRHRCWHVMRVVGELDLSSSLRSYRADGQGAAAYPPKVLLGLVLYCYCKGVRSTRRIEAACLDDVGCRIITGNQHIDHATVARFLRRHREGLKTLFVQAWRSAPGVGWWTCPRWRWTAHRCRQTLPAQPTAAWTPWTP
jgi:Transposase domain (DUF772)